MLADGAPALVAVDDATGETLAMAWTTSRPFHVEEIGATIDPGPGGVYLFGDFVAPAARGRRLQRLLVNRRLRRAAADAHLACTIVHPDNAASVRSYEHEGFAARGRFVRTTWLKREWKAVRGDGFRWDANVLRPRITPGSER
jgi:GNAT superfamily N-acetyltransferase